MIGITVPSSILDWICEHLSYHDIISQSSKFITQNTSSSWIISYVSQVVTHNKIVKVMNELLFIL